MTNLHFHGLEVYHTTPGRRSGDDGHAGETLHYAVQIPPNTSPVLYHTHPHGESHDKRLMA